MDVRFDTYYRYDELTAHLQGYAASYPDLCRLTSLGQSPQQRELWLMEITAYSAGPPEGKPGFYIDGNIHAGEVTSSAACLYTIDRLLRGYGDPSSPEIRQLLETTTFYVRPRVSPDGAEVYLTTPHNLRSVPRPYPTAERQPGLHPDDVDGDGWITQMRIADPDGDWRVSDADPRLMVARADDEPAGGTYYRVYPEGRVHGTVPERGAALKVAPAYWGLDLNRNFPANWQPEHVQKGSGPYPLSEPETRASAEFILAHPNIGIIVCYHTHGHFVFRPPSSRPARDFSAFDTEVVYGVLGGKYSQLTGGRVVQSYDEQAGTARIGSLMDWAYQHLGIVGWVPELWAWGQDYDADGKVGELDLLRWNDEELGGEGFADWRPFDHPQLGPVEIGGWKTKFTSQNPPGKFLEGEIEPHYRWTLYLAQALPRLAIEGVEVTPIAAETWLVTAVIKNSGLLPTNLTDQAIRTHRASPVVVQLEADGLELVWGDARQIVGHLSGRISRLAGGRGGPGGSSSPARAGGGGQSGSRDTAVASWIVRGRGCGGGGGGEGEVRITASADRAGTAAYAVRIG